MTNNPGKIVVLASGRGTNLQALIDASKEKYFNGYISLVISDNPKAYALKRAETAGIPTVVLDYSLFPSKKEYEGKLLSVLKEENPDLICLAGYMRILGKEIIRNFPNKIINIHPSLLPAFPGLEAQKQAVEYGVKVSGCTVHFVDEGMDTGPIILQECCPVEDHDTPESLAERILQHEHRIYKEAVKLFLEEKLEIKGRKVIQKR
ncbi:MAG: phosphoribosylglycinamide formyltransferase [Candidatus Atribacteria bacterium]|nr:phosphoribosylglycinamide formyltransferase [Candidatus Atribacteria bacterium]MCD6349862.1 phosphoribosylglycinamide formyltransferase [Candidatus Atribacteria bacterium]